MSFLGSILHLEIRVFLVVCWSLELAGISSVLTPDGTGSAMSLNRGLSGRVPPQEWLETHMLPYWSCATALLHPATLVNVYRPMETSLLHRIISHSLVMQLNVLRVDGVR
jgi:hypothetical protein